MRLSGSISCADIGKQAAPGTFKQLGGLLFDISESRLLKLAKAGKDAGIELFVVDDGWFGRRNDDTSSLGDWVPNTKKLPGGLSRLAKKLQIWGLLLESG